MSAISGRPIRFYTRARKFPRLIGQTFDGRTIPGGPYTVQQLVGALLTFFVCLKTSSWWSSSGVFTVVVTLVATVGITVLLRQVPYLRRNPVSYVTGVARVAAGPRHGRVASLPVRGSKPHHVKGMAYVDVRDLPPLLPTSRPAAVRDVAETPELTDIPSTLLTELPVPVLEPVGAPMTRVNELLARAITSRRDE